MIDPGRETDGNNEICLSVRFALCIIKALRLARIEHCSGTVVTPLSSSFTVILQYTSLSNIFPKRAAENLNLEEVEK